LSEQFRDGLLMTFTIDTGLHLAEIFAAVIVLGMMKSDVNWLKDEIRYLRGRIDGYRGKEETL
jgi:hypothetical protein